MHEKILEDLLRDSPCTKNGCRGSWCFIRELVLSTGLTDRNAEQIRLIYDYKYRQSEKEGKDIGRERATSEFITLYAKKFAEIYKEGMNHDELYEKIFGTELQHTDEDIRRHINEGNIQREIDKEKSS